MTPIRTDVAGAVYRILVAPGQSVEADEVVALVESMKMEVPVTCAGAGVVAEVLVAEGQSVDADDVILSLE